MPNDTVLVWDFPAKIRGPKVIRAIDPSLSSSKKKSAISFVKPRNSEFIYIHSRSTHIYSFQNHLTKSIIKGRFSCSYTFRIRQGMFALPNLYISINQGRFSWFSNLVKIWPSLWLWFSWRSMTVCHCVTMKKMIIRFLYRICCCWVLCHAMFYIVCLDLNS